MKDASAGGMSRSMGSVQKEGRHQQNVSCLTAAGTRGLLRVVRHLGVRKFPQSLTAGDDTQGTVFIICIIQMQAERGHALQQGTRGLGVRDSLFDRPGTIVRYLLFFGNCNGEILMPQNRPVMFRCFIKENTPDRLKLRRENVKETGRSGESVKQAGFLPDTSDTDTSGISCNSIRFLTQFVELPGIQSCGMQLKPIPIKGIAVHILV